MQRKIKVAKEVAEMDGDEMTRVTATTFTIIDHMETN